jgi:tetratricopeptide (TPR) repeat protein/DNA-binding transcriptional ArsR family regulator
LPVRISSEPPTARTLPRDLAYFTGRESEMRQLANAVSALAGRGVVTICALGGLAGIGKTTLAVHAAHQLAGGYPDGQFFLRLHGHTPGQRPTDPEDGLASLLLAAGVPAWEIPPGLEPRAARWRDFLAGKQVLLVLDDAAGHEQVEPLLPGTPGSTVLVTSRRRLAALEDAAVISLDILSPGEAAEMLVRLAGRPGLRPPDPGIGELTRLCGYLPLAIGMLASQLCHHPAWTPADLADDLVAVGNKLALMRAENVSVDAAFHLSYRDLTSGQRLLFRRLGLQPGPDIDANAAAALGGLSLSAARRHLNAIYDQHLLTEPTRGRYRMHDLVREHARTLAAGDGPTACETAIGRLMDYYLQTALAAGELFGTWIFTVRDTLPAASPPACAPSLRTAGEATRWMDAEGTNLRAAAQHAAAAGRVEYATLIAAALAEFLHVQGRWQDGIPLHQSAAAAARSAGDKVRELRALKPLSQVQNMMGDYEGARASLNRRLMLDRELGDRADEAYTLRELGLVETRASEYPRAIELCQKALAMSRAIGNDRGAAESLLGLSHVHLATGNYRATAESCREALKLYRPLGEPLKQTCVLLNLIAASVMTGDRARAVAGLGQARATLNDLDDRYLQGLMLITTGVVQRFLGDYDKAETSLRAAVEHCHAISLAGDEAAALNELGLTLQLTGDVAAAGTAHQHALAICRITSDRRRLTEVLNSLGELSLRLAAIGDGLRYHAEALALARDIGAQQEAARALEGIGRCHLHDGSTADGISFLRDALDIYQRVGAAAAHSVEETLQACGSGSSRPAPSTGCAAVVPASAHGGE